MKTMDKENLFYDSGGQFFRYLVHEAAPPDIIGYQVEMLIRQKPDYLVPFHMGWRNERIRLCYDLSGLNSFSDYLQQENPGRERLGEYISQIKQYLHEATDYLLPGNQFSLDPELIFLNEKLELKLVFWPVAPSEKAGRTADESMDNLCKLWQISCDDQVNSLEQHQRKIRRTGVLQSRLSRPPAIPARTWLVPALIHFGLVPLAVLFAVNRSYPAVAIIPGIIYVMLLILFDTLYLLKKSPVNIPEKYIGWLNSFQEIIAYGNTKARETAGQPTAIIPQDPEDYRVALLAEEVKEHETEGIRAFILVAEFLIGRDMKKVDLHIPDNGIGRIHARIIRRAGTFFICDQGSKNGTYLDSRRLDKYVETPLPDDCHIKFAKRDFHFQADSD